MISQQSVHEFLSVSTRSPEVGGLGYPTSEALVVIDRLENTFELVPDPADLYITWKRVCSDHSVIGRQVHDARLAALAQCMELDGIVTLNPTDFKRYGVDLVVP